MKQKDHFLRELIEQSADGRLQDQDSDAPLNTANGEGQKGAQDPHELVTMRDFFMSSTPPMVSSDATCSRSRAKSDTSQAGEQKEGTLSKLKGMIKRKSSGLGQLNGTNIGEISL